MKSNGSYGLYIKYGIQCMSTYHIPFRYIVYTIMYTRRSLSTYIAVQPIKRLTRYYVMFSLIIPRMRINMVSRSTNNHNRIESENHYVI